MGGAKCSFSSLSPPLRAVKFAAEGPENSRLDRYGCGEVPMEEVEKLVTVDGEETGLEVESLLATGERYQLARAVDPKHSAPVVIRAILYEDEAEAGEITGRRVGLRREWEFLEAMEGAGITPKPVAWLMLRESPIEEPPEPALVLELVEGTGLLKWIQQRHPEGLEPEKVLSWAADLSEFLARAHKKKWLIRDFDPRRFLVDQEGRLRLVSIGAVVKMGAPLDETQRAFNPAYVAPEIRDELTGTMQRPTADLYGLGTLLSFLLTGEEPREQVESPLSFNAFERLQSWELPGLELLLARLLQPLAKKRIGRAERLQSFCSVENLPTREVRGFEMTMLPAPWLGLEMENPQENRGLRSSLSAGPLVSMARSENETASPAQASQEDALEEVRGLNWPLVLLVVAVVMGALIFAILRS